MSRKKCGTPSEVTQSSSLARLAAVAQRHSSKGALLSRAGYLGLAFVFTVVGCSTDEASKSQSGTQPGETEQRLATNGSEESEDVKNPFSRGKRDTRPTKKELSQPPANAERSERDLASVVLKRGQGAARPAPEDIVTVHYTGWTKAGEEFDTTREEGTPRTFPLQLMIEGWIEGIPLMTVGEKRRFWVPAKLAYGAAPRHYKYIPGKQPLGDIVFDVELVGFEAGPTTPKDLVPPQDASVSKSGLASLSLKEMSEGMRPTPEDIVTVHYSGWTASGELYDSSVLKGAPVSFPLHNTLKGWTEGIQLMREGEKRRFWLPAELAYGPAPKGWVYKPGQRPMGPLIFDIELIRIQTSR